MFHESFSQQRTRLHLTLVSIQMKSWLDFTLPYVYLLPIRAAFLNFLSMWVYAVFVCSSFVIAWEKEVSCQSYIQGMSEVGFHAFSHGHVKEVGVLGNFSEMSIVDVIAVGVVKRSFRPESNLFLSNIRKERETMRLLDYINVRSFSNVE